MCLQTTEFVFIPQELAQASLPLWSPSQSLQNIELLLHLCPQNFPLYYPTSITLSAMLNSLCLFFILSNNDGVIIEQQMCFCVLWGLEICGWIHMFVNESGSWDNLKCNRIFNIGDLSWVAKFKTLSQGWKYSYRIEVKALSMNFPVQF